MVLDSGIFNKSGKRDERFHREFEINDINR